MSRSIVLIQRGTDGLEMAGQALKELQAQDVLAGKARILVKPNITVSKPASTGVTTHVSLVEGVLRFLRDHGLRLRPGVGGVRESAGL